MPLKILFGEVVIKYVCKNTLKGTMKSNSYPKHSQLALQIEKVEILNQLFNKRTEMKKPSA